MSHNMRNILFGVVVYWACACAIFALAFTFHILSGVGEWWAVPLVVTVGIPAIVVTALLLIVAAFDWLEPDKK